MDNPDVQVGVGEQHRREDDGSVDVDAQVRKSSIPIARDNQFSPC